MRLLVLGGTAWLGGAVAAEALQRGHEVICLARGTSGSVPEGAQLVSADRFQADAYAALPELDAAVEVSWQPALVAGALTSVRAEHWVYVSSISVYDDAGDPALGVDAPLLPAWTGDGAAGIEAYGGAKVACEQHYASQLGPDRFAIARAGLIGGYGDRSDRLGYWPGRIAQAEGDRRTVLAPPAELEVQVIDVLDLARWLVHCAEARTSGTYDAVGPAVRFADTVEASRLAAGSDPAVVHVSDADLARLGVNPWAGPESLPLWLGADAGPGDMSRDPGAAVGAGLGLRSHAETVAAALRWERDQGLDRPRRAGLSPDFEERALRALT